MAAHTTKSLLLFVAQYNAWANARLIDSLRPVSDQEYNAHAGLVFRSISGTLQHILLADRLWYARFISKCDDDEYRQICEFWNAPNAGYADKDSTEVIYETYMKDRPTLEAALLEQSQKLVAHIRSLPDDFDATPLVYTNTSGVELVKSRSKMYFHACNHATHHRGQVSAAITAFGHPAPEMDVPAFEPEEER